MTITLTPDLRVAALEAADVIIRRSQAEGWPAIGESLARYLSHGYQPGSALLHILANDLFGAYGYADSNTKVRMDYIVKAIYNELPGSCWGDREVVTAWLKAHREVAA